MSTAIGAGLLAQWPVGWMSDRLDRSQLIQLNAIILTGVTLVLGLAVVPGYALLVLTALFGMLAFTLYPLAVALANDHVEPEERVLLSAMLLVTFGLGASAGPLASSALMKVGGPGMLYVFMAMCSIFLVINVRPGRVTGEHLQDETSHFMPAAGNLASSPLAAALDPRVDEQIVDEQMRDETTGYPSAAELDADQDDHRPG